MIIFLTICVLMILLALWFILPALFQRDADEEQDDRRAANLIVYRDQYQELDRDLNDGLLAEDQFQEEREALERRLLEDVKNSSTLTTTKTSFYRKLAYGVAIGLPMAAIGLYFIVGNPKALTSSAATSVAPPQMDQPGDSMSQQQIGANVEQLAKRLAQNPDDAQGWQMLGRSYMMLERFADAASAYDHLTKLKANDADAWADYAEAQALANDRNLSGKPTEALNRALQIDPKNQKALDLSGSAAFQAGDYQKAISYWQKLLVILPAGSEDLKTISDQIAKAKELAAGKNSR